MSDLMTNFNDHAETELSTSNDLSVLSELSEMLKDIISNIAGIIKRNQNDLKETKDHLEESLNQLQTPGTTTALLTTTSSTRPKPIFEKLQAFNVSRGFKIGEFRTYYHNYEFSMELKHQTKATAARVLQGILETVNHFQTFVKLKHKSRGGKGALFLLTGFIIFRAACFKLCFLTKKLALIIMKMQRILWSFYGHIPPPSANCIFIFGEEDLITKSTLTL